MSKIVAPASCSEARGPGPLPVWQPVSLEI